MRVGCVPVVRLRNRPATTSVRKTNNMKSTSLASESPVSFRLKLACFGQNVNTDLGGACRTARRVVGRPRLLSGELEAHFGLKIFDAFENFFEHRLLDARELFGVDIVVGWLVLFNDG